MKKVNDVNYSQRIKYECVGYVHTQLIHGADFANSLKRAKDQFGPTISSIRKWFTGKYI